MSTVAFQENVLDLRFFQKCAGPIPRKFAQDSDEVFPLQAIAHQATSETYTDFTEAWSSNAVRAMRLRLRRNTWSRKMKAAAAAEAEADTDDATDSASAAGSSSMGSGNSSE